MWRISFNVKIYDESTGKGVYCNPHAEQSTDCPMLRIVTRIGGVERHDTIPDYFMKWKPGAWNTFKATYTVTREIASADVFRLMVVGGPPGSVLAIDNISWKPYESAASNLRVSQEKREDSTSMQPSIAPTLAPTPDVKCDAIMAYDGKDDISQLSWVGWSTSTGFDTGLHGRGQAMKAYDAKVGEMDCTKTFPHPVFQLGHARVSHSNLRVSQEKREDSTSMQPSNTPTFAPAPEVKCDDIMAYDGGGEDIAQLSWMGWSTPTGFDPGFQERGEAMKAYNRRGWRNGLYQNIPSSCLSVGSEWRIRFRTKLYNPITKKGIQCNSNKRFRNSCPFVMLKIIYLDGSHKNIYVRDEDLSKRWNKNGWNFFNEGVTITEEYVGPNILVVHAMYVGGPRGSVLVVDKSSW
eukprot:CAMPEP_0172520842 /NCGR_PEP_ID=MMETSP1066-20121228/292235_1 /TAXON_ID=671091 /ORGANISM="Coscinodiscus wailesii, Strain CCMP2513" /LENGTH=406 /DNA_ID=CAMNT_0013303659 /DNA_START=30 /DNA_END=1248 /DNA_ORIENTATION=+